jgi:hypothetical protein
MMAPKKIDVFVAFVHVVTDLLVVHKSVPWLFKANLRVSRKFGIKRGRRKVLLCSNWFLVGYFPHEEEP